MNRLALGTVQFGLPYGIANQNGQVSRAVAGAMLQLAASKGIDTLDTAITYGESETCLGEAGVQGFKVVTKLPAAPEGHDDINGWVHDQVKTSSARLGVQSLYGLLLHHSDQLVKTNGKELFKALQNLKEVGLVQKIGVSIYAPSELDVLIPKYKFDLVQAPFNLIDRRILLSGWLHRLKQDGVEIHTRSAFLQGLLLMPRSKIPSKFAEWSTLWDIWHNWLAQHSVTSIQASLAYPLSLAEIDCVLVGAESISQLEEIISAATYVTSVDFPDLLCDAESLINPSQWATM